MSVREQQVNDALRVLDEMHRLCRIERDDYRQRRRRLLESLSDATACAGRDTVRRAVPEGDPQAAGATLRRTAADKLDATNEDNRRMGLRMRPIAVCVLGIGALGVLGALACAAASWWFATGG